MGKSTDEKFSWGEFLFHPRPAYSIPKNSKATQQLSECDSPVEQI
jgi:hypothetical protein